jgi:WW domain
MMLLWPKQLLAHPQSPLCTLYPYTMIIRQMTTETALHSGLLPSPVVQTLSAVSGGLPPGWAAALDTRYNTTYFYNASTGERTWQRPATEATPPLPTGWAEGTDPRSGTAYYYNASTGVRQWQRPGGEEVALPLCVSPVYAPVSQKCAS